MACVYHKHRLLLHKMSGVLSLHPGAFGLSFVKPPSAPFVRMSTLEACDAQLHDYYNRKRAGDELLFVRWVLRCFAQNAAKR